METKTYQLEPNPRQVAGVGANDSIYISIQIGNGQVGGSKVMKGATQLAKGNLTQPTFIGKASDLTGSEVDVETNVLDVNNFTNKCVITTSFLNQDNKVLYSKIDDGDAPENGIASFVGKYKFAILLAFLFLFNFMNYQPAFAQSEVNKTKFEDLQTPSSPGFILLDKAPSSIEKPTTPQGFGVNVLGLLQGRGGAMEFAPFWLVNHPKLSAEKMYKTKVPFLHNFSVSVATVKTDTTSFMSGGIRTRFYQSYSQKIVKKLDSVKAELELALADLDIPKIERLQKEYSNMIANPVFTIDFAAAFGGVSMTNSFNDLARSRSAAWLSLNWRPQGDDFYVTLLGRYISNKKFENYQADATLVDVGTRLNYDISKFCLSLEYLQRFNSANSKSDYRVAAIGSYQMSDQFYFTATFGKNFTDVNNIIAVAGINFGISQSKMKAL